MRRLLKFRAFYRPKKIMLNLREMGIGKAQGSHICFGCEEYGHEYYRENFHNSEDWEVMQFIGIKDAQGKEIYEADIITMKKQYEYDHHKNLKWTVKYNMEDLGFSFVSETEKGIYIEGLDGWYDLKVIGNIYENPELIKK